MANSGNDAIAVRSLRHAFGAHRALDDVSLTVPRGHYAVILGPSGSGKTTLLSVLGGFLEPDAGVVHINGRDVTRVPPARRPTTTVFQDYALFPHMSVGANVAFGLRMRGVGRAQRATQAREALALVELGDVFDKRPHALSGGQRQRVALARSLAVKPDVLLLDEPLGALDLKLRRQMQEELKQIQRRVGTTFVHVTHDQEEAMALGDEIVVMRDGRIEDAGPPERVYRRPGSLFSARFMGESNVLDGTIERADEQAIVIDTTVGALELPAAALAPGGERTSGSPVHCVVRPEHVRLQADGAARLSLGAARVTDVSFFGTHHHCRVEHVADAAFKPAVLVTQSDAPALGDSVPLYVAPGSVVVLPAERR